MASVRNTALGVLVCFLAGCSNVAAEPTVLASDTLRWGARPDQAVDWEVQQLAGDRYGIYFATEVNGRTSQGSVRREGSDDLVWLAATIPIPDAPTVVFGGVADEVDSVVLLTAQGDAVELDITPVEGREWALALGELPSRWATAGVWSVEIVVFSDGVEIGTDTFQWIG